MIVMVITTILAIIIMVIIIDKDNDSPDNANCNPIMGRMIYIDNDFDDCKIIIGNSG